MRIKNNIWQHKKTDSTGVDWFCCTFTGFEGDVDCSGYTVLTRNATVQTVIGILDSVWKIKWQVFTSCIGKGFNNYRWQSYFPCPIKLRYSIHLCMEKNFFSPVHPSDLLAVSNVFGWESLNFAGIFKRVLMKWNMTHFRWKEQENKLCTLFENFRHYMYR